MNLPVLLINNVTKGSTGYKCRTVGDALMAQTIFKVSNLLAYSLIPSLVIVVLNSLMIKRVHSQGKFRIKHQIGPQGKSAAATKSMTLTMFAVCFLFIVTTLPGSLMDEVTRVFQKDFINRDTLSFLILERMYLVNHSINFVLYCVTGSVFRQTLVRLLTCHNKRISSRPRTQQCPTVQQSIL